MRYLANFDALTGLSNRILFYDRLRQALIDAQRHDRLVGVAFIDLDRFKAVNDSLGHEAGDVLLKSVGERLTGCVRQGDTVARISGDEFALILADMREADDAARLAHKIVEGFAAPFHLRSKELFIGCSLGLAMFPADETSPEGLVRYADIAMYRAKQSGGNAYQFYRPEMTCRATQRLDIENGLRHAIERQELFLHYQIKTDAHTGAIAGAEALLRWQRAPNEILAPEDFLQIAEETGLMNPIGEWVLEQACRQVRLWKEAGMPQIRVAVNLSQRQLRQPDLAKTIMRTLAEANLEARWLELEVTESMLAQATPESLALLHELSALGTRIVLDDFGTGYSSLSHLARLPVDALKIDRSFIHGIPGEPNDCTIAASVIALAHSLKLSVVAEGVETQEQLHFLQARRCDEVQGLLIGKPVKADEILKAFGYGRWVGPQFDSSEPRRRTLQAAPQRTLDTWGTI
jgi:diguanylate cyclase (GGDEF)-like protein